jgi:geranylgeranyl diphosphate synthase type II
VGRVESLASFLETTRTRVDRALDVYLPSPPECPALVSDAMRHSVFAGGKRLRPILTLAAADAVAQLFARARAHLEIDDRRADLALPAACAIELLHTYSLIHDDLPAMDNDTLRRGRPTLHVLYGDGVAILAGDALQAEAFSLLAREPATDDVVVNARKLRVLAAVAHAAGSAGMVGGQAIDLQAAGRAPGHEVTLDSRGLEAMHRRKTGALIRVSAVSGAIMAGGEPQTIDAVDRWAAHVGLAFQIVDDILDVEGSPHDLGKTAGKDAAGAKPTYPSLIGLDRSRQLALECVAKAQETLVDAGLSSGWLGALADWVVSRRN